MSTTMMASTPTFSGGMRAVDWGLRILIAIAFLGAASAKLAGVPAMVELFDHVGLGQKFRYITAAVEVFGAVLVLIPRLAVFGALILAMTMACAIATHLTLIGGNPVPAIVLLALNLVVLWMRRGTVSALVGRR